MSFCRKGAITSYLAAVFVKEGENMGRPRKVASAKRLWELWGEYKQYCNNRMVLTHEFSAKNSEFVTKELKRSVTYTIEGFCVYIGLARSKFYETYADDDKFRDTVTRMKEECEIDAREKFELGVIPSQLAGLWMSNYGYSTKTDSTVTGAVPVVIGGDDELED